ncbi:sorbosone dehydrogenase family protein [Sphingobium sufflavum]|uniref:PQQ-dependent sugar dehydrogenase n=1 Tax=Sphingobium sufflavum TaxID=1129547 RepID=UPI001F16E305|nr:sorbosone dehydrogenase family protein [Sphingobium sufflavum]MCE7796097.1 sorbosone dehydrogenase family protein [Sphingobium sufflavum]
MKKYALIAIASLLLALGGTYFFLSRGQVAQLPESALEGREPKFTDPRKEILPTVRIADAVGWAAGTAPTAAKGLAVTRFVEGLDHPRSLYRLPNGDVLVAESRAPSRPSTGVTDWIQSKLMAQAGAGGVSANRITLLRDADGDGRAEVRSAFLTGLNSPYGMALVGDTLYVANTDSLMAFPYKSGDTRITAKGRKIINLPANAPNNHWARPLVASKNGRLLYVGIGSATNIADEGLDAENTRAVILEVEPKTRQYNIYASGLRNPSGLAINPVDGALWATVNERDMLGPDLVPDYVTQVEFAAFYGWPWNYWGGYEDRRVQPQRPDLREYTRRPDFGLGAHVAPLGLAFGTDSALGKAWTQGVFIALHGSWNRDPPGGYKLVFVDVDAKGKAQGKPRDVLTGFLDAAKGEAHGRPVDVTVAGDGALLVSDDVGNIVWRVAAVK